MHRWGHQTQVRFSCLKKSRVVLNYTQRDFVSERTKENLRFWREQGIALGKPKGVVRQLIDVRHRPRTHPTPARAGRAPNHHQRGAPQIWQVLLLEELYG